MTAADYDEIRHLRALLTDAYAELAATADAARVEIERLRELLRGRETIQVGDAVIEVEANNGMED